MTEETLEAFLNKNNIMPLPSSNWHNHMFIILFILENYYPKVLENLVNRSTSKYTEKYRTARMNSLSYGSIQNRLFLKSDPVRRNALSALLGSLGGPAKSPFKAFLQRNELVALLCPDTFLTNQGQSKAVFLCHAHQFNPDSVDNWSRLTWVRKIFNEEYGGHLLGKFVCIQDFMEDHQFYESLNFRFEEDPRYWEAATVNIMKTDTDFFPEKTLQGESNDTDLKNGSILLESKEKLIEMAKESSLEEYPDLMNLGFYIEDLFDQFDKISQHIDKEEFALKIRQLYFYLKVFSNKMKSYGLKNGEAKLQSILENLSKKVSNEKAIDSFDIFGKRIATDSISLKAWTEGIGSGPEEYNRELEELKAQGLSHPLMNKENLWSYEMLNHRVFSNSRFFFYQEWEETLKPLLGESQYKENPEHQVLTDFTISPRTLTPSVTGGFKKHSPAVSMHWDRLVYKNTPEKQADALKFDEIIYGAKSSTVREFSKEDQFKLGLCNMLWDLKMSRAPGEDIVRLFECSFWEKILKLSSGQKNENRLIIDASKYNQSWLDSSAQSSLYSLKFERFRIMRKDILKWRELVHEIIPDYYNQSKHILEKEELLKMWNFAKKRYAELLKDYKKNFVRKDSLFGSSKMHDSQRDMVTDLEKDYSNENISIDLEDRALQSESQIRVFSQDNVIKMALLARKKTGTKMSNEMEKLLKQWEDNMEQYLFAEGQSLLPEVLDGALSDVVSEQDFEILAEIFPHAQFERFKEFSISDFLTFINLGLNASYIDVYEKAFLASKLSKEDPSISADRLLMMELPTFNNIGKFLSTYTENYTSLSAANLDKQEEEDLQYLYGFKKEKERNITWTEADFESLREYISDLPLLQNPYESIRKWIKRKESESLIRNSESRGPIKGLTISDKNISRVISAKVQAHRDLLAQTFFQKQYNEVTSLDLTKLSEHLVERMYLLKKNPPLNFFEIVHFILEHKLLHMVDRVNLLESARMFDLDFNDLHLNQILAEYPVLHDDTVHLANKHTRLAISDVVHLATCLNVDHGKVYL